MVSIIIPAYNRELLVKRAIEAIQRQTYQDWEIIVSDNCSTDQTYNVVSALSQNDARIKLFRNDTNVGPVNNWISALSHATGDYVKFLWSDDWVSDNYLQSLVPAMDADKNIIFSFSKAIITDGSKELHTYYSFPSSGKYAAHEFFHGEVYKPAFFPLSPGCAVFRSDALKNVIETAIPNPSSLEFSRYGAGTDLLMFLNPIINNKNALVYYTDKAQSYFFAHADSFSVANNLSEYYLYATIHALNKYGDVNFAKEFYLAQYEKSFKGDVQANNALAFFKLNKGALESFRKKFDKQNAPIEKAPGWVNSIRNFFLKVNRKLKK